MGGKLSSVQLIFCTPLPPPENHYQVTAKRVRRGSLPSHKRVLLWIGHSWKANLYFAIIEHFSERELVKQTGFRIDRWAWLAEGRQVLCFQGRTYKTHWSSRARYFKCQRILLKRCRGSTAWHKSGDLSTFIETEVEFAGSLLLETTWAGLINLGTHPPAPLTSWFSAQLFDGAGWSLVWGKSPHKPVELGWAFLMENTSVLMTKFDFPRGNIQTKLFLLT